MRREPLRSPRLLRKRRKRLILQGVFSIVVLFLIVGLPIILFRLSFWRVQNVEVEGASAVSVSDIESLAKDTMNGSFAYVFPKNNALLYPKSEIVSNLMKKFPRLIDTSVSLKSLKTLSIHVTEREPVALWCRDAESKECFFVDEKGYVFDRAPDFTDNVYVIYTGSITDEPIGKIYITTEEFASIQRFISELKILSLTPASVSLLIDKDYDVTLTTGEHILFTTRQSIEETVSNLQSVLGDSKLALRKGTGLSVSSIDLRFGNKVFYKQKGK